MSVFLRRGAIPATQRRLASLAPAGQFTTAITLGELEYGAEKRGSPRLRELIDEFVSGDVEILPFDVAAARVYGDLRATLERDGQRLDEADMRIAAICLSRGLMLVTGNVKHFSRVPGLRVENWLE